MRRRLLITLAVIVGLTGLAWAALPHVVAALVNQSLPKVVSADLVVEACRVGPVPAAIEVTLPPDLVRREAEARGRRFPLWLARGLSLVGQVEADLDARLTWSLRLGKDGPPRAALHLSAAWVNACIRAYSRSPDEGLTWNYQLAPGTTARLIAPPEVADDRVRWRYAVTASGMVQASLDGAVCAAEVSRLDGVITVDAHRGLDGWWLEGSATVDRCDYRVVRSESAVLALAAQNLGAVIQILITERLSRANLEDVVLPDDFPWTLEAEVDLTDDPLPGPVESNDAPLETRGSLPRNSQLETRN